MVCFASGQERIRCFPFLEMENALWRMGIGQKECLMHMGDWFVTVSDDDKILKKYNLEEEIQLHENY